MQFFVRVNVPFLDNTRLFFPTAICDMLARLRQTKQRTPTERTGQANSALRWTPMRPRRAAPRPPKRHRKLLGHEKRRYLSNVTECNIFRAKPIFDKTNFQRTREPRPNYVRRRSSYARRKHGEFKISYILSLALWEIAEAHELRSSARGKQWRYYIHVKHVKNVRVISQNIIKN